MESQLPPQSDPSLPFTVAQFFVGNVELLSVICCALAVVVHFWIEKSFTSRKAFSQLIPRLFSAGSAAVSPALISCAFYNELLHQLDGVSVPLFVAGVALLVVVFISFVDWSD